MRTSTKNSSGRYRGTYAAPKSKFGRRDVPLTQGMAQALWSRRAAVKASETALVFPSATGGPINAANLYNRTFKPAAKRAEVPWATFHTLRHTCATTLFRHGLNAKQVQGWLGHHAASFTLDTYVHLLADDLPDASFLDALTSPMGQQMGQQDRPRQAENGPEPLQALSARKTPCKSG